MSNGLKATALAASIVMTAWIAIPLSATVMAEPAPDATAPEMYVTDKAMPEKKMPDILSRLNPVKEPEPEPEPGYYEEPVYYEEYQGSGSGGHSYDNGDGFAFDGVRDYNGTTETWYSSNQAYHYRTGEWTPDDEGYYRDADGYYVVASEDHADGEVFDTSKGKAKVYDGGCDSGVTDFYVNF